MNDLIILLIVTPLIASFFCLLGRYFPHLPMPEIASMGAISLCLVFLGRLFSSLPEQRIFDYAVGGWLEPLGISLYLDGLAWFSSVMVMTIAFFALIFAWGEKQYRHDFYFFFLLLIAGMEGVILTGDLFNMFVFIEILSIASYILIAYPNKSSSILASFNYLLISSLGTGFLLLGIFLLYQLTGTLSLRIISDLTTETHKNNASLTLAVASLVVGIGVRAAFIPLHTWLPDAHAYAPHPISAVLSGVTIKVSFLAIWRILRLLEAGYSQHIFLWVGMFTAFLGMIWAIAQTESKKLLAYHSISQMGFIIASFGAATSLSLAASFYHMLNHALFKSLLFLSIGSVIYSTGEGSIQKLSNLGKKMIFVYLPFLIGTFAICGIPPFNGYVSKYLISLSLKRYPVIYFFIQLSSIGTVTSFIKLSGIFRKGRAQIKHDVESHKKLPKIMFIPLAALSVLCIVTGITPGFWTTTIATIITGEKLEIANGAYSLSHMGNSLLILCLGFALYLFVRSSAGQKAAKCLRGLHLGLNNSLLLLVAGFLFLTVLGWLIKKGGLSLNLFFSRLV